MFLLSSYIFKSNGFQFWHHFNWDTVYLPMVITFTNIVTNYCWLRRRIQLSVASQPM